MTFVEGDPYNEIEIANSKKNLQRLGFFKNIQIVDEKIDNQVDLNIMVDEKLTGEFNNKEFAIKIMQNILGCLDFAEIEII